MMLNTQFIIAIAVGLIILAIVSVAFRLKKQQQLQRQLIEADDMDEEVFTDETNMDYHEYQVKINDKPDLSLASLGFATDKADCDNDTLLSKNHARDSLSTSSMQPSQRKTFSQAKNADLIVLNIVAKDEVSFVGYELLQVLLSAGFRYGEMSIFHRHQKASGQGKILFSLASATEPGIFDMNNMGTFSCDGLCLFMQFTSPQHNQQAFRLFLEAAHQLAEELSGVIKDEKMQKLTNTKLGSYNKIVANHVSKYAKSTVEQTYPIEN